MKHIHSGGRPRTRKRKCIYTRRLCVCVRAYFVRMICSFGNNEINNFSFKCSFNSNFSIIFALCVVRSGPAHPPAPRRLHRPANASPFNSAIYCSFPWFEPSNRQKANALRYAQRLNISVQLQLFTTHTTISIYQMPWPAAYVCLPMQTLAHVQQEQRFDTIPWHIACAHLISFVSEL